MAIRVLEDLYQTPEARQLTGRNYEHLCQEAGESRTPMVRHFMPTGKVICVPITGVAHLTKILDQTAGQENVFFSYPTTMLEARTPDITIR